jgi:hypothetical protein
VDDEDDLFGENEGKLNVEGKRLRKMMRERGGGDDYDSSDSVRPYIVLFETPANSTGLIRFQRDYQR